MLLVVVTYKRNKAVWEVINTSKNCEVLGTDFSTSHEAHAWIKKHNLLREVK